MDEINQGTTKINETGALLASITSEVKSQIGKIGSQVDLFKV